MGRYYWNYIFYCYKGNVRRTEVIRGNVLMKKMKL